MICLLYKLKYGGGQSKIFGRNDIVALPRFFLPIVIFTIRLQENLKMAKHTLICLKGDVLFEYCMCYHRNFLR